MAETAWFRVLRSGYQVSAVAVGKVWGQNKRMLLAYLSAFFCGGLSVSLQVGAP